MDESILIATKEAIGASEHGNAFDGEICLHINAAISALGMMGVGSDPGVVVNGDSQKWSDLTLVDNQLVLVQQYIALKTKLLFDPPATSYTIESFNKQLSELEFRLLVLTEHEVQDE